MCVCVCVCVCSCDSCDLQPDTAGVLQEVGHIGSGKSTHEDLLQGMPIENVCALAIIAMSHCDSAPL